MYKGLGIARGRWLGAIATYMVLLAGAVVLMIPFFWMLSTSLKTLDEVNTGRSRGFRASLSGRIMPPSLN
ncbi:MAG: hypothetical protein IAE81_14300 [Caldilineaceae bacterium]|nr:hypothetical protein [Caldilineaceae bacterium]